MNLNALRYFLEVAKSQSIRRASERLHVAASAISRQISSLEHELNCKLLERRSDGVSLTEAGERLLSHGLKIDSHIKLVQSDIDEIRSLHRGQIRIATVEGITQNYLPQVLTAFNKEYPKVSFEVVILSRDETIDALDRYGCDVGFVYDHQYHHAVETLGDYNQPLMAFVPKNHILAGGEEIELPELLNFDHVLPSDDFGINQLVARVAKKMKTNVAPKIIGSHLSFLATYAKLNSMVLFVPAQAVYSDIADGSLIPVNLKCQAFENRSISVAARRQRTLSHATQEFIRFAIEQFAEWQKRDEDLLEQARTKWKR